MAALKQMSVYMSVCLKREGDTFPLYSVPTVNCSTVYPLQLSNCVILDPWKICPHARAHLSWVAERILAKVREPRRGGLKA